MDLSESADSKISLSNTADSDSIFTYTLADPYAHSYKGRFRCIDQNGRLAISQWSDFVTIAAFVPPVEVSPVETPVAAAVVTKFPPPQFSADSGDYNESFNLTLTGSSDGGIIHYTLDGSDPTEASPSYGAPLLVSSNVTVRAFIYKAGGYSSEISTGVYTITAPSQVNAPSFSIAAGTYASAQSISLSTTTSGAVIYYTLDGSTPNVGSPTYSGPFNLGASATVRAMAMKSGALDSSFTSSNYTITVAGDNDAPTLTALSFNNSTIDTEAAPVTVTLALSLSDNLALPTSGTNFQLRLNAPSGSQFVDLYASTSDADSGATATARTFHVGGVFPMGSTGGTWTVGYVYLVDNLGNTRTYYPAELISLGLNVQVQNTAATWDSTAPTLTSVSLSTPTIDTTSATQNLTVTIAIADNFALPASGTNFQMRFNAPTGSQFLDFYASTSSADAGATSTARTFQVTNTFAIGSTHGVWNIAYLYLIDNL
ncbi:MAG: chitobiase/beta-hexosaminidase C-terminal domain-containing protein, partial [Patescibacteria group bacterium]